MTIFLTISEGTITSMSQERVYLGKNSNSENEFGGFKITEATYSYPDNFDVEAAVSQSFEGNLYNRVKNE